MIALGHTNAEVAERLYLSVRTVETQRMHIQQKLRLTLRVRPLRARAQAHRGSIDAYGHRWSSPRDWRRSAIILGVRC